MSEANFLNDGCGSLFFIPLQVSQDRIDHRRLKVGDLVQNWMILYLSKFQFRGYNRKCLCNPFRFNFVHRWGARIDAPR